MGDSTEVVIQRTGNNEIVSIAGRNMAPMPAKRVIDMAKKANETEAEKETVYEELNTSAL